MNGAPLYQWLEIAVLKPTDAPAPPIFRFEVPTWNGDGYRLAGDILVTEAFVEAWTLAELSGASITKVNRPGFPGDS